MLKLSTALPILATTLLQVKAAKTTYLPGNLPKTTQEGQFGTNDCKEWGKSSQDSLCQNAWINSIDDWCLFGPAYSDGVNATVGVIEREAVTYCTKAGKGTRLIPDGTLTSVHFVKTKDYVQISALGDFSSIGIPIGDFGGELDPHGFDQKGNPMGGLMFTDAFGKEQQTHEWAIFLGQTSLCMKACLDGPDSRKFCPHIYDEMGCQFNMPASYTDGVFETCDGESAEFAGIYVGADGLNTTFTQGQAFTPEAKPVPASSNCASQSSLPVNGASKFVPPAGVTPTASPPPVPALTTDSAGHTVMTALPAAGAPDAAATSKGAGLPAGSNNGGANNANTGNKGSDESSGFRSEVGIVVLAAAAFGGLVALF